MHVLVRSAIARLQNFSNILQWLGIPAVLLLKSAESATNLSAPPHFWENSTDLLFLPPASLIGSDGPIFGFPACYGFPFTFSLSFLLGEKFYGPT
jgi:hypothetical protein